ncbi:MAG: DnaB-like helicase C-terminal domain-containing protein [Gemmatimonadaceae bacterium]
MSAVAGRPPGEPNEKTHPFDAAAYLASVANGAAPDAALPSGFPSLDALLGGGFRRGQLIVLGGEASCGKSALALGVALRVSAAGRRAVFLSGEMGVERVYDRALAVESRAPYDALRSGTLDDLARNQVSLAAARLNGRAPFFLALPEPELALSNLAYQQPGLELLVLDPVQWLLAGAGAAEEETARVVRGLKALALRQSLAVLAVSSLRATTRERPDPRPRLDDFGALGSVKQHADVVLGLFREEMYSDLHDVRGAAELHVLKHRGGALGYADLYFYKECLRFEDVVD